MLRIQAFRALRPRPELAAKVAALPYDVMNRAEAKVMAAGNPDSFLHVSRAEIDLPDSVGDYDPAVYAKARESFDRMQASGVLVREERPSLYVYRQIMDGRSQHGLVGCVHVEDYERDLIKKHEKTRKAKEDDRTRHMLALNANAGPVFLTYRDVAGISALVKQATQDEPLYDLTAVDGVRHTVWRVTEPGAYVAAFRAVPFAYVADGHHRAASAARAARELATRNPKHRGDEEYNWFLAALFPAGELRILPYNRVVKDLHGHTAETLRTALAGVGKLSRTKTAAPARAGSFCLYFDHAWHLLELDLASIDSKDPVRSLDASLVHDRILGPVLGVGDPRTDERIDFVGGIRGTAELERRVDSGRDALAVSMFATTLEQLMAIADAGEIMPPKSTWFEPKLRSGLLVHTL